MARVSWSAPMRDLRYRIERLPEDMLDDAEDIVEDVSREGAALVKRYIDSRGTEYSRSQGRSGRRETDEMYNAVDHKTTRFRRSVRGEFGWGVNGGPHEDYFEYQENGFRHWLTGNDVAPMHALLDAKIRIREEFFSRARSRFGARR